MSVLRREDAVALQAVAEMSRERNKVEACLMEATVDNLWKAKGGDGQWLAEAAAERGGSSESYGEGGGGERNTYVVAHVGQNELVSV
jgi:hypothetical protein